ncbi:MAG: insulinase family protein [Sphingobium sp.]|nr:insulinase family protein [Sphingobium sp.]MCP5397703.1 insulinase family protein [Sphingomonas sp.]
MIGKYLARSALSLGLVAVTISGGIVAPQHAFARAKAEQSEKRPWLYENSDVPIDKAWLFGTLPNGVRYAIRKNGVPPGQVSIRVRIDAGSLMEQESEKGYAHFMEHLTFRGSKYVPDGESKRLWQRLGVSFGSDSNAQTTPTGTVYALDLPDASPGGLSESMKILAGMMAEPNIVPAAVDAERAVVLAEMREGTNAISKVGDASRALFFAGQPLGEHAPIGTAESLTNATAETMLAFHKRWYRPENTVVSISGDVDPKIMEALVKQYFSDWKGKGKHTPLPDFGTPDPDAPRTAVVVQSGVPTFLSMMWLRPWKPKADTIIYNQRKLADVIALQMINRRLEDAARRGVVSYLQASVDVQDISRSANATSLSLTPMGDDWEKALADVRSIIEDAKRAPVTDEEIEREYVQFETALAIPVENKDTEPTSKQAMDLTEAVDIRETIVTPEAALEIFRSARPMMTPAYMLDATRRMFTADAQRTLLVMPAEQPNAEGRLLAALDAPVEPASDVRLAASTVTMDDLPKLPPAGKVTAREPVGDMGIETISYANGVKLTLFANDAEKEKVRINVRFGNGMLGLSPDKPQPTWPAAYVLAANGIGTLGQRELDDLANGRRLGFDFGIDENAFELAAVTRPSDYRDQLRLFATKLAYPGWADAPVERAKAGLLAAYDASSTSPSAVLGRDMGWLLRDKDARFRTPGKAEIAALTPAQFRAFWEPILASGPIEVQIFGDVNPDEAIAAVAETFGALKPRKPLPVAEASKAIHFPAHNDTPVVLRHNGDRDQAAAVIAWPTGVGMGDSREARQLDILAQIISDRLFEKLRAVDGAAYSPNASSDWPFAFEKGQGYLAVVSQLKPERIDYFYKLVNEIATDLAANPISDDELRRTLAPTRQLLMRASTGNAFWMNLMEGATQDPRYVTMMQSIGRDMLGGSAEDLRMLAAKYLVTDKSYSVVVLPQE